MSFYRCSVHYYPNGLGGSNIHTLPSQRNNSRMLCNECKTREVRFVLRGNFSDYLCPICLAEMLANKPLRDYWTLTSWRAENVRRMHHAVEFGRTELQEV